MIKKTLLIILVTLSLLPLNITLSLAEEKTNNENLVYIIYDEDGKFLFERQNVVIGDEYITNELEQYIVYSLDNTTQTGTAKFVKKISLPKLKKNTNKQRSEQAKINIGLYMTHNDESYLIGDGYDSIYGAGGIHDIAQQLKEHLTQLGCNVYLDETLHIPHDSKAYSRSENTAINLLDNFNVDFIYDIHRDGASRKTYVEKINNEDFCKIRIVVGKANANYEDVKNYALYMVSIARILHPILFLDIYLANGNYNQFLTNTSLLFEMGSHLVEKKLVEKSIPKLAEVIVKTNKNLLNSEFEEEEKNNETNSSPILPPTNATDKNQQEISQDNNIEPSNPNLNLNNNLTEKNEALFNHHIYLPYIVLTTLAAIIIALTTYLKTKK